MTSNQEKQKILLKLNITRKDIAILTDLKYHTANQIFSIIKTSIETKLKKEDINFKFFNDKYIPTNLALPYLKKYGVEKEIIIENARIEKENLSNGK